MPMYSRGNGTFCLDLGSLPDESWYRFLINSLSPRGTLICLWLAVTPWAWFDPNNTLYIRHLSVSTFVFPHVKVVLGEFFHIQTKSLRIEGVPFGQGTLHFQDSWELFDTFGKMSMFNSQLHDLQSHSSHPNLTLISCWVICRETKLLKWSEAQLYAPL